MGEQSARIFYQGKDHKDIYINGRYHSAVYKTEKNAEGKIIYKLIWRKIYEENLYIQTNFKVSWPVKGLKCITVNMDSKKIYFSNNFTNIDGKQYSLIYAPQWTQEKKSGSFDGNINNPHLFVNNDLVFNNVYDVIDIGVGVNQIIQRKTEYPSTAYYNARVKTLYIRTAMIEENTATTNIVTRNLQNYTEFLGGSLFNFYNEEKYIYILQRSSIGCMLIQSDIYGNIKTLRLDGLGERTLIIAVKDKIVYLMSSKVTKIDEKNLYYVITSVSIVKNMSIVETEVIDTWDSESIYYQGLCASVYNPTVSPLTFVYSRGLHTELITIDGGIVSHNIISQDNFNFFVNVYEDGKIVDTITVSTKNKCTDIANGIIWLFELSKYFIANVSTSGEDIKTDQYGSIEHWTKEGWVDGGTHGVFYDENTKYFYTFYIEVLYPSDKNFFIRFNWED